MTFDQAKLGSKTHMTQMNVKDVTGSQDLTNQQFTPNPQPEFVTVKGVQESIPRNQFHQHI